MWAELAKAREGNQKEGHKDEGFGGFGFEVLGLGMRVEGFSKFEAISRCATGLWGSPLRMFQW